MFDVIIDDREKDKESIELIKSNFNTTVERLKIGDYKLLKHNIHIERKSWLDLWNSTKNKNLNDQILNLLENNVKFMIVITGKISDLYNLNSEEDFLLTELKCHMVILRYLISGIPVFISFSNELFIRMLDLLLRIGNKKLNFTKSIQYIKHDNPMIEYLTGIKGIGIKKSEKLLNEYNDIPTIAYNIKDLKISSKIKNELSLRFFNKPFES